MTTAPEHEYAQDIDGIWHVRACDFWANDISADVRAHTVCGKGIWSCRVSEPNPREFDKRARLCRDCIPLRDPRRRHG